MRKEKILFLEFLDIPLPETEIEITFKIFAKKKNMSSNVTAKIYSFLCITISSVRLLLLYASIQYIKFTAVEEMKEGRDN